MTNPDAIKPVAWLRVEHNVVPGALSRIDATADEKMVKSWAQSPFTISVTPLVPLSALEAAVARGDALEAALRQHAEQYVLLRKLASYKLIRMPVDGKMKRVSLATVVEHECKAAEAAIHALLTSQDHPDE